MKLGVSYKPVPRIFLIKTHLVDECNSSKDEVFKIIPIKEDEKITLFFKDNSDFIMYEDKVEIIFKKTDDIQKTLLEEEYIFLVNHKGVSRRSVFEGHNIFLCREEPRGYVKEIAIMIGEFIQPEIENSFIKFRKEDEIASTLLQYPNTKITNI